MGNKHDMEKVEKMREAAKICSSIFKQLVSHVESNWSRGVTPVELDDMARALSAANGVVPAFLGFEGYPAAICANVNDIVVHGIPDSTPLKEGDILGLDFGIRYKDVYSDMSVSVGVGKIDRNAQKLIETTRKATLAGIEAAKVGNRVGDIGYAMQSVIEKAGFSVVREMVGHGIGYDLHEDPYVPGYGTPGTGEKLYEGQTLAIEAMVNEGSPAVFISSEDGWTCFTKDGMLSALFEHTVVVGSKPEILTQW